MTIHSNTESRAASAFFRRVGVFALAGALLAGPMASSQLMLTPGVAQAAVPGAGIYDGSGSGLGALIHSDGTVVYCLEMGHTVPEGTDAPLGEAASLPAFSFQGWTNGGLGISGASGSTGAMVGTEIEMLKYIIGQYGTTSDNNQAAAVQLAAWDLRTAAGDAGYVSTINQVKANLAPDVVAFSAAMIAEAAAYVNSPSAGTVTETQPGAPVLTPTAPYAGTVAVEAGTVWAELKNAKFAPQDGVTLSANGTRATFTDGQAHTLQWTGTPGPDAEFGRYYRVTLTGGYEYSVSKPGALLIANKGGIDQILGAASAPVNDSYEGTFKAQYVDPDTFWAPTLSTVTETKLVKKGQKYSDTITFEANPDVGSGEWRFMVDANGKKRYAPITAKGTIYGPYLQDPAENPSGTPPKGAPVVGTAAVTTSEADGPEKSYQVSSDAVAQETGYITWVWEIVGAEQLPQIIKPSPVGVAQASSIPEKYHFVDGFGQKTESQWTPTELDISTQLSASTLSIGDSFTDDVTVKLGGGGGWLQDNGKRIPATLRGTVYESSELPVQQAEAPADAKVLGDTTIKVNTPGQVVTSDAFSIPMDTSAKYITVQWCLNEEDQTGAAKTKFEESCDDYGVPSETAEVLRPEVTTQAQEDGAVYDSIVDTATVQGTLPDTEKWTSEVDFTAYLKPEAGQPKYDENWEPVLDADGNPVLWTEEEVTDPEAVCDVQPVGKTDRVPVNGLGDVKSPEILAQSEGTVYWVEELHTTSKENPDETYLVHRGICGLPNETTEVKQPEVTTQAQELGAVKGDIVDTALVSGPVSTRDDVKYEVDFTAYLKPEAGQPKYDENWEPVLDADGKPVLWTKEEVSNPEAVCDVQPVGKTDRVEVSTKGEYTSPAIKAETAGTVYWVEELYVTPPTGEEKLVHRGLCGLPNETTEVEEPTVSTKSAGTVEVGEEMYDVATVEGPLSERDDVEYKVTFKAYERFDGEDMVCTPETELKQFEDKTGVKVTKPGEYTSKKVVTKTEDAGLGGYVETLIRVEDGEETIIAVGACGEKSENFEVREPKSPAVMGLADTGSDLGLPLVGGVAGLLAAASVAALLVIRKRKTGAAQAQMEIAE